MSEVLWSQVQKLLVLLGPGSQATEFSEQAFWLSRGKRLQRVQGLRQGHDKDIAEVIQVEEGSGPNRGSEGGLERNRQVQNN